MGVPKTAKANIRILDPAPSYAQFLQEHLERNIPCLIGPDLVASWPACSLWRDQASIQPNWKYMREQYGKEIVSVAHCGSRKFSDQEREERLLHEVIELWESGRGEGLYVKDWHLAKSVRERGDPPFYETPSIFRDDWMNSFWDAEGKDDFRFVYMGIAGTFTPLHCDVYASYSWSTNVAGTKLWRLFPPKVSHLLRRFPERASSEIVYDVRNVDRGVFRGFEEACQEMLVVEQPPGWTIFIPSRWYHQVENVTSAISINHNWCNITNIPSMYTSLLDAVADVQHALDDVEKLLKQSGSPKWEQEWVDVVQDVLCKDSGWELSHDCWLMFWRMILHNMSQQRDLSRAGSSHTLCPPFLRAKTVVWDLMDDFLNARALELKYIPELSGTLRGLREVLACGTAA